MKQIKITYYKIPLTSIPFHELPSLSDRELTHVFCSSIPLLEFMGMKVNLLSVYNLINAEIGSPYDLQSAELLFGEVISESLPLRGKSKYVKLGTLEREISAKDLPDLRYNAGSNWYYLSNGRYVAMNGIPSEHKKVRHLEGISIYSENIIRLRIVVELLKKNVKSGKLTLSAEEYLQIGFKVLRSDPSLLRATDSMIWNGVHNWIPQMLSIPVYAEIPEHLRGRVLA